MRVVSCVAGSVVVVLAWSNVAHAQNPAPAQQPMTFFITSAGKGDGANLGGLAGADAHCKALADASGAPLPAGRTWRAYSSAHGADGSPINARDRIGAGPWHNAKGAMIAANVADLHGDIIRDRNQMNKVNALTEKGAPVNGARRHAERARHPHRLGLVRPRGARARPTWTCNNWTSNAATGSAMVGHHDRTGGGNTSWNSAHASRGCGQQNLVATGGAGLVLLLRGELS